MRPNMSCLATICAAALLLIVDAMPLPANEAEPGKDSGAVHRVGDSRNPVPSFIQKRVYKKVRKEGEVDFLIRSAAIGDFDGDGLNELISTDGKTLRIVQWHYGSFSGYPAESHSEKGGLARLWPWGSRQQETALDRLNEENRRLQYISLSSGDLDGDGRDEALFTAMDDHDLVSGILRYDGNGFGQSLSPPGLYLKLVPAPEGPPVLIGQQLSSEEEQTFRYGWNGSDLTREERIPLPDEARLFSAGHLLARDAGEPYFVRLTEDGTLEFFDHDLQVLTTTKSDPPEPRCTIRIAVDGADGKTRKKKFRIPRSFLTGDFDGDGRGEVLVSVKRPVVNLPGGRGLLVRHTIADLVVTQGRLWEYWNTAPIFGEILDVAVGDIDNNGRKDLVVFAKKGLMPLKRGTRFLIYEL